jgi:hypothetical protein
MTATQPHNRVSPYLNDPPARQEVLGDAVIAAVVALQGLLRHDDPAVVLKSAAMILDLERTRLRHDRPISGTEPTTRPAPPVEPETTIEPHGGVNLADPMIQYIEQVRKFLQNEVDAEGTGEVVPWEKAEWIANRMLQKQPAPPVPTADARPRCPPVPSGDTRAPVIHFSA